MKVPYFFLSNFSINFTVDNRIILYLSCIIPYFYDRLLHVIYFKFDTNYVLILCAKTVLRLCNHSFYNYYYYVLCFYLNTQVSSCSHIATTRLIAHGFFVRMLFACVIHDFLLIKERRTHAKQAAN